MKRTDILLIPLLLGLFLLIFRWSQSEDDALFDSVEVDYTPLEQLPLRDLGDILESGRLNVLTRYSPTSYFVHGGIPMGFEYEIFSRFADHLGVDLYMYVPPSWEDMYEMLEDGRGDVIASNMIITTSLLERFAFSVEHNRTRQILVQAHPEGWRSMRIHERENTMIRSPLDLIGKKVTVREGSVQEERLVNLNSEMGGGIIIDRVSDSIEVEDLIRMVSQGKISYTVAEENMAFPKRHYYRNIDILTPISLDQSIGWVFRWESPELRRTFDEWFKSFTSNRNPYYNIIYNRYFRSPITYRNRVTSNLFLLQTGGLSIYDSLFKKYESERFPWTLLASLAYQESSFNPESVSRFGALGLMQLMPNTAKLMGVDTAGMTIEQNIYAGARYLEYLYRNYWSHLPHDEAIRFSLASYNAGPGHVYDAQRVADREGWDRNVWDGNVERAMAMLSTPEVYRSPEVRHGYCDGEGVRLYVRDIIHRDRLYRDALAEYNRRKQQQDDEMGEAEASPQD